MSALSQFFSHLYTITLIFFTLLFLELVILVRSVTGHIFSTGNGPITTAQYLKLIERKNPASRFKAGLKEESKECSVCLSTFEEGEEIRKLKQCKHTFHKDCLDTWLRQDCATCPLCRRSVLPEEIVARYRRQRNNQDNYGSDEDMLIILSALQGNYLRRLAY